MIILNIGGRWTVWNYCWLAPDTNQSQHLTLTAALSAAKGRTTITSCLTFSVMKSFSLDPWFLWESPPRAPQPFWVWAWAGGRWWKRLINETTWATTTTTWRPGGLCLTRYRIKHKMEFAMQVSLLGRSTRATPAVIASTSNWTRTLRTLQFRKPWSKN